MWDDETIVPATGDTCLVAPTIAWEKDDVVDYNLTPEQERAEYHRLSNLEQGRQLGKVSAEKTLCQMWDVEWRDNGDHWRDLRIIRDDVKEIRAWWRENKDRNTTIKRKIIESLATALAGAGAALGLDWISKRTGVHLPPGAP